jgi:hypothetical protein
VRVSIGLDTSHPTFNPLLEFRCVTSRCLKNITWEQTADTRIVMIGGWGFQSWLGELLVLTKLRQSAKLREIAAALKADGFIGLDAQARALGLSRSTAWTIISGSHKSSGLTARTLNRMLAAPLLGERARAKILEYIAEKQAGHYGTSKLRLRQFDRCLEACPPSPLTRDDFQISFENREVSRK